MRPYATAAEITRSISNSRYRVTATPIATGIATMVRAKLRLVTHPVPST